MNRSIWKGPFVDHSLIKHIQKNSNLKESSNQNKRLKIWSRRSIIIPEFVGYHFDIYNGHKTIRLFVTEDMIGHKFGEFSSTRKKCEHKKKK